MDWFSIIIGGICLIIFTIFWMLLMLVLFSGAQVESMRISKEIKQKERNLELVKEYVAINHKEPTDNGLQ